ncbi:MAG TPA: hypothetical protein VE736_12820 [Gaiellaceae bacterium]|nr:hypothetical protein [Gaiellaceae bacterium]
MQVPQLHLHNCLIPGWVVTADERGPTAIRQSREVRGVPIACFGGLVRLLEAFEAILADRVEHEHASVAERLEEARVHESREHIEIRLSDLFCRVDREASGKDREPPEERLRILIEKVVTPRDCGLKRALTFRQVARTAGEERQAPFQSSEERRRVEQFRSGGRKLEGQRKIVQARTDLGYVFL